MRTVMTLYRRYHSWMLHNFLKLNGGKTEFLVISKQSMSQRVAYIRSITIGSENIPAVLKARNIEYMQMQQCALRLKSIV